MNGDLHDLWRTCSVFLLYPHSWVRHSACRLIGIINQLFTTIIFHTFLLGIYFAFCGREGPKQGAFASSPREIYGNFFWQFFFFCNPINNRFE